jgi:glycine amidinotransferase
LLLNNPIRKAMPKHNKLFEINGWEIIEAAQAAHEKPPPLYYSRVWLSMNVLIVDQKAVFVEASEIAQIEQLDKLGFEIIPVPFRDPYPFGGGLQCATMDVCREGSCLDYFPKQVRGF